MECRGVNPALPPGMSLYRYDNPLTADGPFDTSGQVETDRRNLAGEPVITQTRWASDNVEAIFKKAESRTCKEPVTVSGGSVRVRKYR